MASIPKGTRDFSTVEMARRNYIFNTIKSVFSLYGFQQIETPAMENMSTLMGKYGEEGDKLLFRIQNSGEKANTPPEKGLRYDLTVPFARYVVQHREEIQFPFKRFQIQPVWRADRPQKGRYREFYQCDVDVIGTQSLTCEWELIQIVQEVYRRLGIRVRLHINNRKILAGIAEVIGQPDKLIDITVAIDKLDKIGLDNVNKELLERGLTTEAVEKIQPIMQLSGSNTEKLDQLSAILQGSEVGMAGISELRTLFDLCTLNSQPTIDSVVRPGDRTSMNTQSSTPDFELALDLTLARGLNYYTGAIFEVKALDAQIGSITGGGRYDNLTGIFGMPNVSGVGISFGADRIYDVLTELNLFPAELGTGTQLLFATFGEAELRYALRWATALRQKGLRVEVYPEPAKMKKQMGYADAKQIPWVAIVGGNEMESQTVMLKNMTTGEQQPLTLQKVIDYLKK
ncbi:MAG: histidine--tRNA ligase [Paludibacteraceae bacterium]|nr:histidine--tRNA ligase [Paludibacteraceae bacterium]